MGMTLRFNDVAVENRTIYLLPLLCLHLGCSPDVRIDVTEVTGSGGSSSSSSSTGSSSSSSSSASSSSSSGGENDDGVQLQCIPSGMQPQGPLCGPPSAPCRVLIDEQIPIPLADRDDAPVLILMPNCTPWILFSSKENGVYYGFEALRDPLGEWSVHETPFDFSSAGLVMNKSGTLFALPNDGAFGTSLWSYSGGEWVKMNDVPAPVRHDAHGVVMDTDDTIHAAFETDQYDIMLGRFDGAWSLSKIASNGDYPTAALSPEGALHIAWKERADAAGVTRYHWQSPPMDSQIVRECSGNLECGVGWGPLHLTTTAADEINPRGKPHLLLRTYFSEAPFNFSGMYYMTSAPSSDAGSTAWHSSELAHDMTSRPLGVTHNDAGEVRVFYTKKTPGGPGPFGLHVAWQDGDNMQYAVTWSGFWISGASFALDSAGNVHIAMYVHDKVDGINVRYLVLGI